jgi:HEAT repeat protein/MFS family permease
MAAFLSLNTANTTVISAAKNGLFLSEYAAELIPYAIIAAALVTAIVAIAFAGIISRTGRRMLALGLTVVLGGSLMGSRLLVLIDPRSAFVLYLWLAAVQVLIVTHSWTYLGSLFTGRQAKRLLPLIGIGASVGAIIGGAAVGPAARQLGTANLLGISAVLLAIALPLLWLVPEPGRDEDEVSEGENRGESEIRSFVRGAGLGFRWIRRERLLRLLAYGVIALTIAGTLIDLQLKLVLNATYEGVEIAAIYGYMAVAVGIGTLFLQLWASRVLFPKLGVSFAAKMQGGTLALASGGLAVASGVLAAGSVWALAGLQSLEDILQHSLQKPVEQVSLVPFPRKAKSAVVANLGGVLRPLSKAAAGIIAIVLASRVELLPAVTVISAAAAFFIYTRHRPAYMSALEGALVRHSIDFATSEATPLVIGRDALEVIDNALEDPDPTVVVFAVSLMEQLPIEEATPRATRLLAHEVPEVRAEAALVLGRMEHEEDDFAGIAITSRFALEESPLALAALLTAAAKVPAVNFARVESFLSHDDPAVRRACLVALGQLGPNINGKLSDLLTSDLSADRAVAAGAVGDLGIEELMAEVANVVEDLEARPAALEALAQLGRPAVTAMSALLDRRELPLPTRRTVVTALSGIDGPEARDALLDLVEEPGLGPAALTSLRRMRLAGQIGASTPARLRAILEIEIGRGLRYSLAANGLRKKGSEAPFVAKEFEELSLRSVHRVLRILSLSYDQSRIATVASAMLGEDPTVRNNALELLEGTISSESGSAVMPFMEAAADAFAVDRVTELVPGAELILENPGEALLKESDWWPRALGLHLLGRDDEILPPGRSKTSTTKDETMIPLIEKVMILKGSELFRDFPGADLAGIGSLADVVHLQSDEIVFEQDDEGDAFYMVVRGGIRITRGSIELAVLGTREGFGEMAILDRGTRSATATAVEATTLLRIDQNSFDRLIEQNPAVARGIYRVLTQRLRSTLDQVAAGQ